MGRREVWGRIRWEKRTVVAFRLSWGRSLMEETHLSDIRVHMSIFRLRSTEQLHYHSYVQINLNAALVQTTLYTSPHKRLTMQMHVPIIATQ